MALLHHFGKINGCFLADDMADAGVRKESGQAG